MQSGPKGGGTDAIRYKRAATLLLATPDLPFALIPALNTAAAALPQAAYRMADSHDSCAFENVLDAAGVLGYLRATADTLLVLRQTSETVSSRVFRQLLSSYTSCLPCSDPAYRARDADSRRGGRGGATPRAAVGPRLPAVGNGEASLAGLRPAEAAPLSQLSAGAWTDLAVRAWEGHGREDPR